MLSFGSPLHEAPLDESRPPRAHCDLPLGIGVVGCWHPPSDALWIRSPKNWLDSQHRSDARNEQHHPFLHSASISSATKIALPVRTVKTVSICAIARKRVSRAAGLWKRGLVCSQQLKH